MALDKLTKVQSVGISSFIQVVGVVTATQGFDGNITGIITATGDFSIADKIVHTGDTNTALRFPAADTFTVETAGSERVRITSDGKVGIGNNTPDAPLRVTSSAVSEASQANDIAVFERNDNGYLKVYTPNNKKGGIVFGDPDSPFVGATLYDHSTNKLEFWTGSGPRMYVDSSGSVGIGTDNPGTNLDVLRTSNDTGGIIVRNTNNSQANARAQVEISGGDNADGRLKIECNGTEHTFRQDGNGNLQIHNASAERVRIASDGDVQARRARSNTAGDVALSIQPSDSTIHYGFRIDSANNNLNLDRVGTGNFVSITSGGNIGIGTDNPYNSKLQVFGKQRVSASAKSLTTDFFVLSSTENSSNSNDLIFRQRASDNDWEIEAVEQGIGYHNVWIKNGNLKFTSGKGIDFSATGNGSGTMSSEVLDDYEEGSWTPDLQFGGAKVGISYNNRWGRYTKVGNLITVIGRITLGSKGSSGGIARFFGLPYVTESITGTQMSIGSLWYSGFNLQGSIVQVVIRTDGNGNSFVEPKGVTTNSEDAIGDSDFANNTDMVFNISYRTP